MGAEHRIVVRTHDGEYLRDLHEWESLQYGRFLNDVGWFMLIVSPEVGNDLPDVDRLFEFYRKPEGGYERLEMVGFTRYWDWFEVAPRNERMRIGGEDQMGLLRRRIVAFASESDQSSKTGPADDVMKAVVRENMGTLAPLTEAGRPRAFPPAHFEVMDDTSAAPSITRSFAWRNVLDVLHELAESSRQLGTPLFFDVESTGPATFAFRTWINIRGTDRTVSGPSPLVFSLEAGNLNDPFLREDWRDEHNYIWGGGGGIAAARVIDPEKDILRIGRSIWAKTEAFQDAREEGTDTQGVANRAFERLQRDRPRTEFRAELLDTPQSRYGVDWKMGDLVTVRYRGRTFDMSIRGVQISVSGKGKETLTTFTEMERVGEQS